jgi:uncharacterized membrane protein YdjX (TVP38/TMEM64 family)
VIQIKYPKLSLFILSFIVAYLLFSYRSFAPLHNTLLLLGYFGTFLTGILYAYGFTAPPATAMLLILAGDQNIVFAGLVAGLGALLSDLIIFLFIRHGFTDEIERLSKEKIFQYIQKKISTTLQRYMLMSIAGFLIASPLPHRNWCYIDGVSEKYINKKIRCSSIPLTYNRNLCNSSYWS